jgi:hypothetical protein
MTRTARLLTLLVALVLAACADVTQRIPTLGLSVPGGGPTAAEVQDLLANWATDFAGAVTAASDRIRAGSTEREVRRHTLLWQLRMVPLARQAAFRPDPQEGYVAVLAIAEAHRAYLTSGEGRQLFGSQQALAVEAAQRSEAAALQIGRSFLSPAQLERLERQVAELVAANPIQGVFVADALLQGFAASRATGMFGWVIDLPMVPFRALSGVSDTALAVQEFNDTAREFTHTLNELPHLTRWELELLLYDTEELESVERTLHALEEVAASAEGLPAELGAQLSARLEEARASIEAMDAALARAENVAAPLERIAERLGKASDDWTALLAARSVDAGEEDEGRPFDVREYEAAAARIAEAGRELRELADALRAIDASGAGALLDAAAWRAGALIVVFFVALAGYRFATARLRRRDGAG